MTQKYLVACVRTALIFPPSISCCFLSCVLILQEQKAANVNRDHTSRKGGVYNFVFILLSLFAEDIIWMAGKHGVLVAEVRYVNLW